MSKPDRLTGHCLCARVTFECDATPRWVAHCHCESCRRNCSAPYTTYFCVPMATMQWTGTNPATYQSSPGVRRLFCAHCGTPMAYTSDHYAGEIHLYLVSLDDAEALTPTIHVNHAEKLAWVHTDDGLKKLDAVGSGASS